MTRRDFLKAGAAGAALATLPPWSFAKEGNSKLPVPQAGKLPRWRGFNLLEKFIASHENSRFLESDFEMMAEWGFNFARLPMSYLCWSSHKDWRKMDERVLSEIDEAIALGEKYGIHVSLNFHRAPGYSVDSSVAEPFNLWKDAEALEACNHHWAAFAKRYRGIPNERLSFDLVNEPAFFTEKPFVLLDDKTYERVVRSLVATIREVDAGRLIIADGLSWGAIPAAGLSDLGIAQSRHSYFPHTVSHWKAEWVEGSDKWPEPTWPYQITEEGARGYLAYIKEYQKALPDNPIAKASIDEAEVRRPWGKEFLRRQFDLWKVIEAEGVGVHVGEFGCYNKTPHAVTLAFLEDNLALFQDEGWGWALWNLRGDFGILDSGRADVAYENFRGHQLDRKMLELLQRY